MQNNTTCACPGVCPSCHSNRLTWHLRPLIKKKKKLFITIPKAFSIPPSIRIQKQEVGEIYKAAKHFFQSSNCDNKCKNNPFPSFLVSYVFTVICVCTPAMAHLWRSTDNSPTVFSSFYRVGSGNGTQVTMPLPLEPFFCSVSSSLNPRLKNNAQATSFFPRVPCTF